jgi:tRNAThr (cytosine32-N3)-methyltransferase
LFSGSPAPPESYTISAQPVVIEELEGDAAASSTSHTPSSEARPEQLDSGAVDSIIGSPLPPLDDSEAGSKYRALHPHFESQAFLDLPHPLFKIVVLAPDRRLLVNRKRQLKMYRIWMQGTFRKTAQYDAFESEDVAVV